MSQMRNENGQLALPRVRLPCDTVSEEEREKAPLSIRNNMDNN